MATGKVLVVDDSQMILRFTKDALEKAGYEVRTSDNVFVARLVNEFKPDVILMDVTVHDQKGNLATKVLKKHTYAREAKVLLYSVQSDEELVLMAADCGADGFIHKTGDPDELCDKIGEATLN